MSHSKQPSGSPTLDDEMRYFQARQGWEVVSLREVWQYRELLASLIARDFKVQYRQTMIGIAWAVLRPLIVMVVFTTLFRLLGRVPASDERLYAVSIFAAQLPWQLFATTLTKSTKSLVVNKDILTKVYFPRLILPLVPIGVGLVDFGVGFVILLGLMVWYSVVPTIGILLVPLFVMLAILASFSLATWLSAANALYRDVEHAIPFLIQIGMFVSPVVYEMRSVIPEQWTLVYSLNPMVVVLEGFRWAMLGTQPPPLASFAVSTSVVFSLLVGGLFYFRRVERTVADRI